MPIEFEIAKEVALDATPEEVWTTIATEAGLATWFQPVPIDPASDTVVVWQPPQHLAIRTPRAADGSMHAFDYLIRAAGDRSLLRFVHGGLAGEGWSDEVESITSGGWDMYLHTLASYHANFAGRGAVYIEADGPPSSSAPEAWPDLIRALGDVALGAPITIRLPCAEPLDGVVDYVTPNYIGMRAADALIRFHGRSALGMSLAVGHHAYGEVDAEGTRRGWASWLGDAVSF